MLNIGWKNHYLLKTKVTQDLKISFNAPQNHELRGVFFICACLI